MTSIAPQPGPTPLHQEGGVPRLERAAKRLAGVRTAARLLVLTEGLALTLTALLGLLTAEALTDAALRLPEAVRWIILILGTAAAAWLTRRWIVPALRWSPKDTWIALRYEGAAPPESGVRGLLASGLELGRAAADDPVTRALARRSVERAAEAFDRAHRGNDSPRALRTRPAARAVAIAACVFAFAGTLAATNPDAARTALARALTPWTDAEWPRRTDIADATAREVHPSDTALPVRAHLLRTNREPGQTRVELSYRVSVTDAAGRRTDGPVRTVVMTPQSRRATVDGVDAEVFERLIDPSVFAADSSKPGARTLSYSVLTEDDRTPWATVRLVRPPRLVRATATVDPPDYAAGAAALASGRIDLGRGTDARAIVGPVLTGSRVRVEALYDTEIELRTEPLDELRAAVTAADPSADIEFDGETLAVDLFPTDSARFELRPTDRFGFAPREETVLSIDVVPDRDPSPSIVDPPRDESVLATALVPVRAEARDDIGLESLTLRRVAARVPRESPGAALSAGDPFELGSVPGPADGPAVVDAALDLAELGLRPGDEVRLTATAEDARAPAAGRVDSGVRTLTVIDESEFVDRLRSRLEQVRRAAARLDRRQGEVARGLPEDGSVPAGVAEDQAALTERLNEQRRAVEALDEQRARNRLEDQALGSLFERASGLLGEAAESSAEAARAASAGDGEQAEGEQREVRRDIGRLLELLDRGEDGWVVRRALERLLDDQRRLASDTARAGEGLAGREAGELNPDERSELERIAQRQRELAERAERTIDELDQRGERLSRSDPGQSEALQDAASAGRQSRVTEQLREAAEAAEQNRTADANREQRGAAEAIEEMLKRLDQAERLRDRALKRVLASLVERLEALIAQQRDELTSLAAHRDAGTPSIDALGEAMIALHGRTLALTADAAAGPTETAAAAEPLAEAGQAQVEAIDALRADPASIDDAATAERVSLQRLEVALDLTRQALEEAEERDRQRVIDEVRRLYRAALDQQAGLREETEPFVGRRLARRERADVRGLGRRQTELAEVIRAIPGEFAELADTPVVALIHRRLDGAAETAGASLERGRADAATLSRQRQAVELLRSLLDHLGPQRGGNDDDFADPGGGGGGGGGGEGGGGQEDRLVEFAAELRLLRDLQALAATLTRETDAAMEGAPPAGELAALQREITEQAVDLLDRVRAANQGGGGGGGGGSGEPDPAEPDAGDDANNEDGGER